MFSTSTSPRILRIIAAVCTQTFLCTIIASAQPDTASRETSCLSPKIQMDTAQITLNFADLTAGFSNLAIGLGIGASELAAASKIVTDAFDDKNNTYSATAFSQFPTGKYLQKITADFYRQTKDKDSSDIISNTNFFAIKSNKAKIQPLLFSAAEEKHLLVGYVGAGGTAFYDHIYPVQAYIPYGLAQALQEKIAEKLAAAKAGNVAENALREIIQPAARLMKLFAIAAKEKNLKKKNISFEPFFDNAESYNTELTAILTEISRTYGIDIAQSRESSGILVPQRRSKPELRQITANSEEVTKIKELPYDFYAKLYDAAFKKFKADLSKQLAQSYFNLSIEQLEKTFDSFLRFNRSVLEIGSFGSPFSNGMSYLNLCNELIKQTFDTTISRLQGVNNFINDMTDITLKRSPAPEQPFTFGQGGNLANTPNEVVYESPILKLRRYAPKNKQVRSKPIFLSYSWINKYEIFDLDPDHNKSMIKYLLQQGFEVYVTDWQEITQENKQYAQHIDDYVQELLNSTLLIRKLTGEEKIDVLGYCIGGTLMMILASLYPEYFDRLIPMTSAMLSKVGGDENSLTDPKQLNEQLLYAIAHTADPYAIVAENKGIFPKKNLRGTFGFIQPSGNDNQGMFELMQRWLQGIGPAEHPLLAWNERAQNPGAAHAEILDLVYDKSLLAKGKLHILGRTVDLKSITQEIMILLAEKDHIVLPEAAKYTANLVSSEKIDIWGIPSGHVGIATDPRVYAKIVEFLTNNRSNKTNRKVTEVNEIKLPDLQNAKTPQLLTQTAINSAI
ncbi:MAG: alpha/beta fold hydrolase [Candidatus Omnitrophica bacterium]|nr:alpha/beta fold hydrolase [Candidatus Omnitrophota bacterium]